MHERDDRAIERYRYLLRTAPPEAIEEAHAEAFARLTPEQRARVLREIAGDLPPSERPGDPGRVDPRTLARLATRAELREPGLIERRLGGVGMGGLGAGGLFAGSLLSTLAGAFLGTAIAHQLMGGGEAAAADEAGQDEAAQDEPAADEADFGEAGDFGGGDLGGGDLGGGGFGDF